MFDDIVGRNRCFTLITDCSVRYSDIRDGFYRRHWITNIETPLQNWVSRQYIDQHCRPVTSYADLNEMRLWLPYFHKTNQNFDSLYLWSAVWTSEKLNPYAFLARVLREFLLFTLHTDCRGSALEWNIKVQSFPAAEVSDSVAHDRNLCRPVPDLARKCAVLQNQCIGVSFSQFACFSKYRLARMSTW
jgi:hypothetical protein